MTRYKLWVRVATTTLFTVVFAENVLAAQRLGEAQYGVGNVLDCMVVDQMQLAPFDKYIKGECDEATGNCKCGGAD